MNGVPWATFRSRSNCRAPSLVPHPNRPSGVTRDSDEERIDLDKRAAQKRGCQQVICVQYGARVVKTIKTIEAT
jgi:hypothetical protein